MKKICLIPLVFLVFACNSMKNSNQNKDSKSSLYTQLYSSAYQGRETESNVVVHNQDELNALFKSVNSNTFPKVDFTKNQVAALFIGTRNTGGYNVFIDRVEEDGNQILIYKKIEKPSGEMVTMALTNPFIIVEIHSKKEIVFK